MPGYLRHRVCDAALSRHETMQCHSRRCHLRQPLQQALQDLPQGRLHMWFVQDYQTFLRTVQAILL